MNKVLLKARDRLGRGQLADGRERLGSGQWDDEKGESFGSGQLDYGHLEEDNELMVEIG